jgi:hypothetical protein
MNTQPLTEAQHADGFVDFYALIGALPTLASDELRDQINALYKEAQTDRDHRTPARRREAQLLLELLPQARTILLDSKRRRRYDAYRGAVEMQSPRMPFPDFLPTLLAERETASAGADILSVSGRKAKIEAPRPVPVEPTAKIEAPVIEVPRPELPKAEVTPAPSITPTTAMPTIARPRLPLGVLVGGASALVGLCATLPTLAAIPIAVCAPLALVGAGVVGYVFSLTGDTETEAA